MLLHEGPGEFDAAIEVFVGHLVCHEAEQFLPAFGEIKQVIHAGVGQVDMSIWIGVCEGCVHGD